MKKPIYLQVEDAIHAMLLAESRRDGVPMSVVVRRYVLSGLGVNADGSPRKAAK